jgi:hypothetical protein
MKYLLKDQKLTFVFRPSDVTCHNYIHNYYQTNEILSFAVIDLAFKIVKIIKQQKRKSIILKKRKPIIHLLNYVDVLNSNFNSNKFDITFSLKNNYKTQLTYKLYLHRSLHRRRFYKDLYKDSLIVIESENSCIIRLEDDYAGRIHPKNLNLATMLMYILNKEEINMIDVNGIIFYCVFLM